ncbi:hypothetical protein ACFV3R_24390 [Streptomyces sp. NPDC059740]|uniref:hypothetical protein n=1 Tax=Streptomyces sp. NPDC059740 TaxID=3346926 RepID=UPI0036497E9D
MGRGAYGLARVAVIVRAPAGWLWWPGLLAAGIGLLVPGLTGRRVGLATGVVLLVVAALVAFGVRRRRYTGFTRAASRAAKMVVLQDRAVTLRQWRRGRRWWLLLAFLAAVASAFAVPAAGGLLMAGFGVGLWAKSLWLGRWERRHETLLWVRPEWAARRGPVGPDVRGFLTTGLAAGDAAPGGGRARSTTPPSRAAGSTAPRRA